MDEIISAGSKRAAVLSTTISLLALMKVLGVIDDESGFRVPVLYVTINIEYVYPILLIGMFTTFGMWLWRFHNERELNNIRGAGLRREFEKRLEVAHHEFDSKINDLRHNENEFIKYVHENRKLAVQNFSIDSERETGEKGTILPGRETQAKYVTAWEFYQNSKDRYDIAKNELAAAELDYGRSKGSVEHLQWHANAAYSWTPTFAFVVAIAAVLSRFGWPFFAELLK